MKYYCGHWGARAESPNSTVAPEYLYFFIMVSSLPHFCQIPAIHVQNVPVYAQYLLIT